MRIKKLFFVFKYIFILCVIFSTNIKKEPSWVYLKRAENLKEKGEYAFAIMEAQKARKVFIKEKIDHYYKMIREIHKDKIEYELTKMIDRKEEELLKNDNYPQYHELMGDLYILTDFIDKGEEEYQKALSQKKYFEYPQKIIEIKYKIANIYNKKTDYELEDIIYREITKEYFDTKNKEYWERIRYNIKKDPSLSHVFRIYRIDGIEYLQALYRIGRRSALLQRKSDALFFLVNAATVWMTYYSNLIKKYHFEFQYSSPTDFINYISKKRIYEYQSEDYMMDEILFFIGYIYLLENEEEIKDHYFNLAKIFSKNTKREEEINNRIEYFKKDKEHILTYEEFID